MTSSGIKRGLAATAISALAVAGLPLLAGSASAVDLNTQAGGVDVVNLVVPIYGAITNDADGTYRLQAIGGNDVSSVRFEYSLNGGTTWTPITTVASRNDNGSFAYEWSAAGLDGASITLRAVGLSSTGAELSTDSDTATIDHSQPDIDVTDGNAVGVFQQPGYGANGDFVVVRGHDSDTPGQTVWGYWFDGSAWQSDTVTSDENGDYAVPLDITGYPYGANDQILLGADNDQSSDSEAYNLYKQTITTVTASADSTNIPAGSSNPNYVTVTVTDQNGNPIDGAQVYSSDAQGPFYTDANGQVVDQFVQGAGSQYYYANATNSPPYEPELGDQKSNTVTVTQYNPAPTSLAGSSDDGAAFDNDEYDANDITVQVKDQNGNNFNPDETQTLSYHWVFTPFDGGAAVRYPTTGESGPLFDAADTSDDGKFTVPMPALDADGGTYELFASLSQDTNGNGAIAASKVLTVKAGDSNFVFDQDSPEQSTVGGAEPVGVTLQLDDGTGLPNRPVEFSIAATTGNAAYDQTSGPDAATYDTKTDANGHAVATLDDPNADTTTERDTVQVDTLNWTDKGGDTDNAAETAQQDVVFARSAATAGSTIAIDPDTAVRNPGEVADVTGTLKNSDTTVEPDTAVTLTTDHGYFTNAAGTANYGQQVTVVTDSSGIFTAHLTIGRDAGFDDNGDVTSIVTATSGPASDTEDYQWTSDYNSATNQYGSKVDLAFSSPANQTVTVLPKAPFETENVCLDVWTYDTYGNLMAGVPVTVSGDFVSPNDTTSSANVVSDLKDDCDVTASQDHAGSQDYTATWTNGQDNPGTAPDSDLTDTETIDWYAITATTVTLTHSGTNPHPVGSTVTMTYKAVDQNGEPIDGYTVEFYRSGPDDTHTGELQVSRSTNAAGEAYYVFQGEVAGTAKVTTVLYDTHGNIVPAGQASDDVTFGGKIHPSVVLKGHNNGARADRLKADGPNATAGATVKLQKRVNGAWKTVKVKAANSLGNARFKVRDRNGNHFTKYRAKYGPTAQTFRATSNTKRVR